MKHGRHFLIAIGIERPEDETDEKVVEGVMNNPVVVEDFIRSVGEKAFEQFIRYYPAEGWRAFYASKLDRKSGLRSGFFVQCPRGDRIIRAFISESRQEAAA